MNCLSQYWVLRECKCYQENDTGDSRCDQGTETGEIKDFEEQYREIAIDCFRYFGFTSFDQVDQLTIAQYEIMAEAARLKEVDKDYRNHLQVFLNFCCTSKKESRKEQTKAGLSYI